MQSSAASAVSRVQVKLHLYSGQEGLASNLSDLLYASLRSYRKDRCAVLGDYDLVKSLVDGGLDAKLLFPDTNYHWSGIQRRVQKPWKRIIAGDYSDWFLWFMKWQRFRAFHTVVLVNPLQYMLECEFRGYIDGLLARLISQPINKVIVLEGERFESPLRAWVDQRRIEDASISKSFGEQELRQAIMALLYGTWLTKTELQALIEGTFWSVVHSDHQLVTQTLSSLGAFTERRHNGYWHLSEEGAKLVQGLAKVPAKWESGNEPEIEQLFVPVRRKKPASLPDSWLETQVAAIIKEREWVTVPILERLLSERHEELRKNEDYGLREVLEEFEYDTLDEARRRLSPSRPVIRRILEKFVQSGHLEKYLWSREIGRASIVYCLPNKLPFRSDSQCGQCAFYISLRHRCRLWWLLDKSFHSSNPRWGKGGGYPLSLFEIHKMKNSWRIGPHSSACLRFLDKKRDYRRKTIPEYCDICYETLPTTKTSEPSRRCDNCGTRYFTVRNGVRVLTSYEHEFGRIYKEIAGREPGADLEQWKEERSGSTYGILERAEYESHRTEPGTPENPHTRTLVFFPNDTMFAKDGKLFVLKKRRVEAVPLTGTVIVDHLSIEPEQKAILERAGVTIKEVPKRDDVSAYKMAARFDAGPAVDRIVRENPEVIRGFALAMAKSEINATRRIVSLFKLSGSEIEGLVKEQTSFLRRLEHSKRPNFLVYEALIMRRYWSCYDIALRGALARFGPRVKSRFVRDYVSNLAGRARGYSAVDAAINYLHQRRLLKCRLINAKLGLGWNSGEGFLHRRSGRAEPIGLLLDLTDPFKFADREKLLEVILSYDLNWRDFYIATDRQGAKFYYPQPRAIEVLELKGMEADSLPVRYGDKTIPLLEAYECAVAKLIETLQTGHLQSYTPFVYEG